LMLPDPIILGLTANAFLVGAGLGGFLAIVYSQLLVGPLGLTQEIAILPGLASQLSTLVFSGAAIAVNYRIGLWNAFLGGLVVCVVAWVGYGAWPILFLSADEAGLATAGVFIFGVLASAGGAFATPAYLTIIAGRVPAQDQAKAQSLVGFAYAVGVALATWVYSLYIFDASATGQRAVLFCYVTAGIYVCCCVVIFFTYRYATWETRQRKLTSVATYQQHIAQSRVSR
jgi:hypothetical protein